MNKIHTVFGLLVLLFAFNAHSEISGKEIHVGILTDASGPYADVVGQGALVAAELAAKDVNEKVAGAKVVVHFADHKNNPEVALKIAKEWHKKHQIDIINELSSSPVAIAVQAWAKEHGIVTVVQGALSSALTGAQCSPTGMHWGFDTYALANSLAKSVTPNGGDKWFVITLDNAFGKAVNADLETAVRANGGKVVGSAFHPYGHTDFKAIFKRAKNSDANVVLIANAGTHLLRQISEAKSPGVLRTDQRIVNYYTLMHDIRRLGLVHAHGLQFVTPFYWDLNKDTHTWAQRFIQMNGSPPSFAHAGVYSSLMHYFKAVENTSTDNGVTVVNEMKKQRVRDIFTKDGQIREDGSMVHELYLMEVKSPIETAGSWDYFKMLNPIRGADVFRPESESKCQMVISKK